MPYNILLIHTDDQEVDSVDADAMPYLASNPLGQWVTFTKANLSHPVCYPARSSLLTGLRSDHHRRDANINVLTGTKQAPSTWEVPPPDFDDDNLLPRWLQGAGYETGGFGKYLNDFPWDRGAYVPVGWDTFWMTGTSTDYTSWSVVNSAGATVTGNGTDADYLTDRMRTEAETFITGATSPWFCYFAPIAPHKPFTPASRHAALSITLADPENHNPASMPGKPTWLTDRPAMSAADANSNRTDRLNARRSLRAVDEAIESLIDAVVAKGQLDNTIIIYLSDNGQSFGRWRLPTVKNAPYRYCVNSLLRVRHPLATQRTEDALVNTLDVTRTIVDWAGAETPWPMDGLNIGGTITQGAAVRSGVESRSPGEYAESFYLPMWWVLETADRKLIEWPESGEVELYDTVNDPHETANIASDEPDTVASMRVVLSERKRETEGQRQFRGSGRTRRRAIDAALGA